MIQRATSELRYHHVFEIYTRFWVTKAGYNSRPWGWPFNKRMIDVLSAKRVINSNIAKIPTSKKQLPRTSKDFNFTLFWQTGLVLMLSVHCVMSSFDFPSFWSFGDFIASQILHGNLWERKRTDGIIWNRWLKLYIDIANQGLNQTKLNQHADFRIRDLILLKLKKSKRAKPLTVPHKANKTKFKCPTQQ